MSDDVGVLVIARNAAGTIDTALAGIAGQSSPPGAVLVVDDGSDDATAERASTWSDRLPLRVERIEPSGVGAARRHGVAALDRPLIAQLDADDYWLTDHLSAMERAYEPGRLVFARDLLWCPGAWIRQNPRTLPPVGEQLHALLAGNRSSAGVLFEREAYERVGGYRTSLRASEDWDLYLRLVRDGAVMRLADEPTLLYRISPESTSAGYKTAESDVAVLEHAREEATSNQERAWIDEELALRRARLELSRALEAVESGRPSDARAHARAAARHGDRKTRAIAAAMVVAPRIGASMRARASARRWASER